VRILAVSLLYPPHNLGGYELICDGVMRAALARGHELRILASDFHAPGVRERDELPVARTLRSYLDASAERAQPLTAAQRLQLERANAAVMERTLREFAPQVVNWWAMGGMSLSLIERVRRRGLPAVLVIQDDWLSYGLQSDAWTRMSRRVRALAPVLEPALGIPIRYRLERAGRFLFNSERSLQAAARAGIAPPDCAVVSPGVHARYLHQAPSEPWRWRLLYVGRLDPAKGIDLAVAALARLPAQATLTIAGAGGEAYGERLLRQAAELGVRERVQLVGAVGSEQLPALYARADAVLFPIRWEEPWGLVPLEAMGVGCPVVAVAKGGARTYLRDGENCLLVPPEDDRALADAVGRLASDGELRARLRSGGARTAAEHSAERYEQRVLDELELAAYSRQLARPGRPALPPRS